MQEYWSVGILEYWGVGESVSITPLLQFRPLVV